MSDGQILEFIRIGNEFAKIAAQAASSKILAPSQISKLMIVASEHKRQMGRYHDHVHERMKALNIDFAILSVIYAQMAFPPFRSYCDWWLLLVEQLDIAPIQPESDSWVLVKLSDCEVDRSTMLRHSRQAETTGVRQIGRGKYEIRRSQLAEYLHVRHRSKYGIQ